MRVIIVIIIIIIGIIVVIIIIVIINIIVGDECQGFVIFAVPKIPKNMKYEIPNLKPTLDYYEPTYVGE